MWANRVKPERMRRVVIIDDETAFAAFLSKMVRGLGYDVMVSTDPRSNRTIKLRDSDIVFLDVLMPTVAAGVEDKQLARQNVKSAIVCMSGHGGLLDTPQKDGQNFWRFW